MRLQEMFAKHSGSEGLSTCGGATGLEKTSGESVNRGLSQDCAVAMRGAGKVEETSKDQGTLAALWGGR